MFDAFAPRIGTDKQHAYACDLARKAGFATLRHAYSSVYSMPVSKVSKIKAVPTATASKFIARLLAL